MAGVSVNPAKVALYKSAGLSKFKSKLFDRIGGHIEKHGGMYVPQDVSRLDTLPPDIMPIVGCQPETVELVAKWRRTGRVFATWDRGYFRRIFATWLPRAESGSGYYRWHVNSYQLQHMRNVPDDRWKSLRIGVGNWQKNGKHIVVAVPSNTYARVHSCQNWTDDTVAALGNLTDRKLILRDKESPIPLQVHLDGAHALVTHGSIAAVESIVIGCPVFVHSSSAASLVGLTDLAQIENPIYPDRQQFFNSLSYSQFDENELIDGTLWRFLV